MKCKNIQVAREKQTRVPTFLPGFFFPGFFFPGGGCRASGIIVYCRRRYENAKSKGNEMKTMINSGRKLVEGGIGGVRERLVEVRDKLVGVQEELAEGG